MGPHTDTHDHYGLVIELPPVRDRYKRGKGAVKGERREANEQPASDVMIRYSRVPKGIMLEVAYSMFQAEVRELWPGHRLIGIFEDRNHEHPVFVSNRGRHPTGDLAHMP